MFGSVAAAIDEAARGAAYHTLPHHLKKTYDNFLSRLQEVAQGFFESHVRGALLSRQDERHPLKPTQSTQPAGSTAYRPTSKPLPTPNTTRPTYAHAAAQPKSQANTRKPNPPNRSHKPIPSPPVDGRLFLRLEQDATERQISPYPLLLHLRKFLGENSALLKEVQHVPSGLALRLTSDAASPRLEALFSEGIKEGKLKGALGIEKAQNLVTYLLFSIPRFYTALDEDNKLTNFPITADHVCSELTEEKGLASVAAFETRTSIESPQLYS
ncbi:hypothetical protein K3495_g14899 [Podosphaera aphanis]|nr:hypothetical protein K3495_g14899 [Podosphaera aphanis]